MLNYVDKLQFVLRCINSGWYRTLQSRLWHWTCSRSCSKKCC